MSKSFLLTLCTLLSFVMGLKAQAPCAFDKKHKKLLETDPVYARQIEQNNISIRKYIDARRGMKPGAAKPMATVTIPVVVHVMHTGGAVGSIYNPTDAQIMGAIDYLNQVYAGTFAGMTAPVEGGGVVDMEIQFALAQRTPACVATNGIDRVDASSLSNYIANGVNAANTTGCPDLTMKNFSRWNPSDYYNIWIVNKIDGADGTSGQFIAGYAFLAGASSTLDGTVMLATQMTTGEKTLPHEIGHALNLYHPFEDSDDDTDCPTNADCTNEGDFVCDTDPVKRNYNVGSGLYDFACRTGVNSCNNPTNHTINTESNFMSYTNCYTLFTNGQKARAQAAMALPSRASLVDPGNLALTPCGTTVNFSQVTASRTEDVTGTLTGCRRYRDYTYQMAIGAAPTATATATLTYSGTAVKGIDYDVTTNGNFASPSDVLTFNSGSTTAQSFMVRIYDDADVEAAETAILDFTINNGGGDAAKGTTTPTFTITISDNDLNPLGSSSGSSSSIGTYTANIDAGSCFRSNKLKHRAQFLVTKAELNTSGINDAADLINLRFRVATKNSTKPYSGFTVSLGHTANIEFSTGFVASALTQVYTGNYTTVAGNNDIVFSTPFAWDGESNIIVNICFENATADAANDIMEGSLPASPTAYSAYSNYTTGPAAGCSLNASTGSNGRPNMIFGYSVSATPVETTIAGSSSSEHIELGSDDYFYSNNNRLLMHLSAINASLGCVAASLDEAGSAWINYKGGQRSAKVFAVTPTTNGLTAGYTASFYFDNAELGGKTPATLRIAKTSAASLASANSSNTVLITPTVTALGSGTTIFTASFTGFSRFFLIDAGVVLPVELTDLTVKLNNDQDAVIKWTTSSEYNNRGFEIETSRDGLNFTLLGTVASQGNSAAQQHYEYLHIKPQPGVTLYRLKQTDIDGKFEYSKIISLNINTTLAKTTVYPVPAKDKITIKFGALFTKTEIEIFSADMKTLIRESINGPLTTKEINISKLARGIYFIRYANGSSKGILSFIKE